MIVLMFQPRFAELVVAGTKRQTIRPPRKRGPTRIGEVVSLRRWADRAYRSPQLVIGTGRLLSNDYVELGSTRDGCSDAIVVAGQVLDTAGRAALSRADGFACTTDMLEWFEDAHGLPFYGVLYRWDPL